MKKTRIVATLITTFVVGLAQAQEIYHGASFELGGTLPPNQSIEYKATDFIHLKKGFLSSPQSPNYAMLEIDPYFNPEMPYDTLYWQPADCAVPGRLGFYPMSFDVNETGAAVITMPLEFPEGVNGMTPHLSLNYNSQGGNGILGLGWSLGGMSKISRVPYTYMYNDSCHAVQFTNVDELSLDGVILRKGMKNGIVCYYPEVYDYSIVYPINSNGSIDKGFRVLKKDGTVCTYSAKYYLQSQLNTPIEWHLSRVEDPFGNYIEYKYVNDESEGAFYPDTIRYTCHSGLSPVYEILFEYAPGDRNDCPPKYFSRPSSHNGDDGFSRIMKKIGSIQCWHEGRKIMSYKLEYRTLDQDLQALSSVAKQFFDGAKWSYNLVIPTEFQWKETDYQLQYETAAEGISTGTNYDDEHKWYQQTAFAARFEHDNLSGQPKYEHDIVQLLMVKENRLTRHRLCVFRSGNIIGEQGQQYQFAPYDCNDINDFFADGRSVVAFLPADTDGDGLNEIVCVHSFAGKMNFSLIRHNGQGRFYRTDLIQNHGNTSEYSPGSFQVGDFNGDGLSDLFFVFNSHPHVLMSKVGAPLSIEANIDFWLAQNRKIAIGDFNGDKKDQIVILMKDQNHHMAKLFRIVATSNGGFVMTQQSLSAEIAEYYYAPASNLCYRMCSGDFNGDGKKDILLQCHQSWRFYFSEGNGVFTDAVLLSDTIYTNDNFVSVKEGNNDMPNYALVADLDNDGCDDISIMKVQMFDGPSLNVPNNTVPYRGVFRRDFLVRLAGDRSIRVSTIKNLRSWWENGNQLSTDRCIDSIEYDATIAYSKTNPFLPIMGNHKGTAPNEIMTSHLEYRNGAEHLGIFLRNTGCLDNPPVRAINKIVTSTGATTEIEYRPVSYQFLPNNNHDRDDGRSREDDRDLTATLPYYGYMNIVEKVLVETDDAGASQDTAKTFRKTRYHFSRPYYHTRGRGFLGFKRVWSRQQGQNNADDIFSLRYFSLNQTYSIMVPEKTELRHFESSSNNTLQKHQETHFEYGFQTQSNFSNELGQIPNDVFSPYLKKTVTTRTDGSPISFEKETFQRDGFGNVKRHERHYGTSASNYPYYERDDIAFDNDVRASRWIIGIPKNETLTQKLCQEENLKVARRTSYENDMNTGRHIEKRTAPGDEKQKTETYFYDDFGNLVSITSRGSGETRTETIAYSEDGRFPIAKTNAMGQTTTYSFDEATGKVKSITDPNDLTTQFRYDILGNLIQTEYPTGVLEDRSMWWVGSSLSQTYHPDTPDFGCPVYFTYSKRSGERESYVFYDQHNRKLREVSSDMNGRKIYVDCKYYDISGLLRQVSNPYFHNMGETPQFSTYQYDYLGRNTRTDRADGGFMSKVYNGTTEITTDFDGQKTTLQYTKSGLVEFALRHDGNTNNAVATQFSYYGDGKVKTANSISHSYDINRNPLSVKDPSLGELTYNYNAFGELVESSTSHNLTHYTYDALGRITRRKEHDGISYWYYDDGFVGALSSSRYEPNNGPTVMENYQYDRLGQMIKQFQKVGNEDEWTFNYTYDRLGRQSAITYPSGKRFKYYYDGNGFMKLVKDAQTGEVLWQANTTDRWGNITGFTEGDIAVAYEYDPVTGLVTSIGATRNGQPLFAQSCHWTNKGNLEWRTDETLDLKECFGYDGYNRLVSATMQNLDETQTYSRQGFDFDSRGNITQKTGVGSYAYGNSSNPCAVTRLLPEEGQESLFRHQQATYTAFDKLRTMEQGNSHIAVDYGIDRQRVRQTFRRGSSTRAKRHFTPLYESITENGVTKNLHYLTAGNGLFAIFATQSNGTSAMHYTLKDHQGSLTATVCGNAVERLSYDAWGRRRNPNGFGYGNVTCTFDRGYTLHEHYDDFRLINMNGRMYDPVIGRMLSPDIAIQDEYNAQAYNRYSYCFNNPLRFTDPSGYFVTIPPEFEKYYMPQYFDDFETYKRELEKLDAQKVSFNTEQTEGKSVTILSWMIENDAYQMTIVDHGLRDYSQMCENSCVASSFAEQEGRFSYGNERISEDFLMSETKTSCDLGMKVNTGLEVLLLNTSVYSKTPAYLDMLSDGSHGLNYYERRSFVEMNRNNGVFFRFFNSRMSHVMNASQAVSFLLNGKNETCEIRLWDSDFSNGKTGGYRSLTEYDLKVFYGKMGTLFIKQP